MRIGLLTSVGRTLDAFFTEIVEEWRAAGHEVFPAAGDPARTMAVDVVPGLTQRPSPQNARVPARLARWAADRCLDVVVTNTATASTLVRLAPMPCKVVYFCHGLHWNDGWHPAQVVERLLLRRTDSVITINSDDHAWLSARHPHVRLLRQGVGVPESRFPWSPLPAPPGPGVPLRLVWAGDLTERKRPLFAVEVARHLRDAGVDLRLTMLGDGALHQATRAEVGRLGLADVVDVPGRGPVQEPLRDAHALLHTASWEGLPRILLEGVATGRRAFAFDVKGVRDVPHVLLAPDGDTAALARLVADEAPRLSDLDPAGLAELRSARVAAWLADHLEEVVG